MNTRFRRIGNQQALDIRRTLRAFAPAALALILALLAGCAPVRHGTPPASQHDNAIAATVAALRARALRERTAEVVATADPEDWRAWMREAEAEVLATQHVRFRIARPALVSVFVDRRLIEDGEPFWLAERGFARTGLAPAEAAGRHFEVWQKRFPAGEVGLGVHALRDYREHYFVTVAAADGGEVAISALRPQRLALGTLREGESIYSDRSAALTQVPRALRGQTLIRTLSRRRDAAALYRHYRLSAHPPLPAPDHVVLTWSGAPATTQAIQWRTAVSVATGALLYAEAPAGGGAPVQAAWRRVDAATVRIETPRVLNAPVAHRHTVELRDLRPATRYAYAIADTRGHPATPWRYFRTAPAGAADFAFLYFGDAQEGFDRFGGVLEAAYRARPDARFAVVAGDLVNDGHLRDEWDAFLDNASPVFASIPLVPALGNHEVMGREPRLYLDQFALPRNGPAGIAPERAYHLVYGDALFVVLDSNLDAETQAAWLERTLAASTQRWKIAIAHHPAYPSREDRYYADVREVWAPILERHGVQLVLQGHDHAYLRTHPMRDGRRVPHADRDGDGVIDDGTIYVVSNAGTKFYEQSERDYAATARRDDQFWQVIEIDRAPARLRYRAYDSGGSLIDSFELR